MKVMTDVLLHPDTLPALFQGKLLLHWLLGVLYAGALVVAARRLQHDLTIPVMLVAATELFYIWWGKWASTWGCPVPPR